MAAAAATKTLETSNETYGSEDKTFSRRGYWTLGIAFRLLIESRNRQFKSHDCAGILIISYSDRVVAGTKPCFSTSLDLPASCVGAVWPTARRPRWQTGLRVPGRRKLT